MAHVFLTPEAEEQARQLPKAMQQRLKTIVKRLEGWPIVSGVKALTGNLAGWYRLRFGDYRLRFHVKGDAVTVDKIGHRKDVYED